MSKLPSSITELTEPSDYLQEVIKTPPRWVLRWGETLLLALVIFLFVLGWIIEYPDRIPAQVIITTSQPPVPVKARANGTINQLVVQDHELVDSGQLLAVIQTPANYSDIVKLKQQLLDFTLEFPLEDTLVEFAYQLGTLQQQYAQFQEKAEGYRFYQHFTPHFQEQKSIGQQLQRYQELLNQKQHHVSLLKQKIALAEKDYHRNKQLHHSQTIADKTLEASAAQWLETKESYEILLSEISQLKVNQAGLRREWQQLQTKHSKEGEQLRTSLLSAKETLLAGIAAWEELYLLRASQSGKISFSDFWSEQQVVQDGQTVMSILPVYDTTDELSMIGQIRVSVVNSGKIKKGQRVDIYLANYPYTEYGSVRGMVKDISALPKQGYYNLTVDLPNKLMTEFGYSIPFQQRLQGDAEIVTNNLRLLERLFYRVREVVQSPRAVTSNRINS
ncbi:MAG: HlyD family efflux transporter periplasmic adaptor subunit [Cyclobacteriaceae bacterium]